MKDQFAVPMNDSNENELRELLGPIQPRGAPADLREAVRARTAGELERAALRRSYRLLWASLLLLFASLAVSWGVIEVQQRRIEVLFAKSASHDHR